MLLKGNCLETLKTLDADSVDSIVTDPPYELGFMGKSWDASGIAYNAELWGECLRVLKPGGHLLAFSGSRTYHRMVVAIEDSGFEIRDQIMWLYGSGFPKSKNVALSIDKGEGHSNRGKAIPTASKYQATDVEEKNKLTSNPVPPYEARSEAAQQWQGWGTALKPAHEPIVVARKPLIGTVANNVLTYGTGGLNIDGSRVGTSDTPRTGNTDPSEATQTAFGTGWQKSGTTPPEGRFPANIVITHSPDCEQVGTKEDTLNEGSNNRSNGNINFGMADNRDTQVPKSVSVPIWECVEDCPARELDESSRYFTQTTYTEPDYPQFLYCAKAGKKERNAGLEEFEAKREADRVKDDGAGGDNPRNRSNNAKQNFHPTVKPLTLMRHLVKLVTPPNGTVLDPFLGSGTTAMAATLEGFQWIGCEMTEDYWPIIEARMEWAAQQPRPEKTLF